MENNKILTYKVLNLIGTNIINYQGKKKDTDRKPYKTLDQKYYKTSNNEIYCVR